MKFCTSCGNPLEENANACTKCGATIVAAPAAAPAAPAAAPAAPAAPVAPAAPQYPPQPQYQAPAQPQYQPQYRPQPQYQPAYAPYGQPMRVKSPADIEKSNKMILGVLGLLFAVFASAMALFAVLGFADMYIDYYTSGYYSTSIYFYANPDGEFMLVAALAGIAAFGVSVAHAVVAGVKRMGLDKVLPAIGRAVGAAALTIVFFTFII